MDPGQVAWVKCWPIHLKVAGSIPGQNAYQLMFLSLKISKIYPHVRIKTKKAVKAEVNGIIILTSPTP